MTAAGATFGWAQGTGGLTGVVTDPSGAVVAGAQVTILNPATGSTRTSATTNDGSYLFPQLSPATYRVEIKATGFKTAIRERADVVVGLTTKLDIGLEMGEIVQTVLVQASSAALNTQDASVGVPFNETQITQLPLEGRNIVGLLSLQAGAVYLPTSDFRSGAIQGGRSDQSTITLDGVSIDDPENETAAFQSSLRTPLDSVQEFRTTTSNYGADQGRSGGAQVQLVTKSGTNQLHGSLYEFLRNTATSSNEYFNKLSELQSGKPNRPPTLNKNTFGASAGGPIIKNRLFIFGNYEGLRESSTQPVLRGVPSEALRDGVLIYPCAVPAACVGGTVTGLSSTHTIPSGFYGLTPAQFAAIDPLGIGPNLAVTKYFQQFPSPNDPGSDGVNLVGFRFTSPLKTSQNTGVFRLDFNNSTNHSLFLRGVIQDDVATDVTQFTGQPPNDTSRNTSKGIALGYNAVLRSNLVNSLRVSYNHLQVASNGLQTKPQIFFQSIDPLPAITSTSGESQPTYEVRDDLTWTKGRHTLQFGGDVLRTRMPRSSNSTSFSAVSIDPFDIVGVGRNFMPGRATCTTPGCNAVPAVNNASFGAAWANASIDLWGIMARGLAEYNYTKTGGLLPSGALVKRDFGSAEYEWYIQDQWHLRQTLTLTFGLRHTLISPPWEVNGNQVAPTPGLTDYLNASAANAAKGIPRNVLPPFSFNLAGPANGQPGYYPWDPKNFAPRISAAWNPDGHGKTVVRGGYSIVYDRIGPALAREFDTGGGSFGLSTIVKSPTGAADESTPADTRFTGLYNLPGPPIIAAAPPGGFPTGPPVGQIGISTGIDNGIRTPYSHVFNVSVGRELPRNLTLEVSYLGRLGRRLLTRRDIANPVDLVDPKTGVDYYTAASQLAALAEVGDPRGISVGTNTHLVQPISYFEDLWPGAAGHPPFDIYGVGAASTATQAFYDLFLGFAGDYGDALLFADFPGGPFTSRFGTNAYYPKQFCCYTALSTVGESNYNALELSLHSRGIHGLQFSVNYTYSHSLDATSAVERGSTGYNLQSSFFTGGVSDVVLDPYFPRKGYSNSDFDVRHQLNANWIYELPFGRGKWLGKDARGFLDEVIGGWQVSGLYRITSGFPFNVLACMACFTTNDAIPNNAVLLTPTTALPKTRTTKNAVNGFPSPFADPAQALLSFKPGRPGDVGLRNALRGDGYFSIDLGLGKSFRLPHEGHTLQFRWETFNITNTSKFNTNGVQAEIDQAASFGRYNSTLATCDGRAGRCMQFALRYQF